MKKTLSLILAVVLLVSLLPLAVFAAEETEDHETFSNHEVDTDKLYNAIPVHSGQLVSDCSVVESDIYGYVVNYPLKKGHVLSISDTNYVFSVRKLMDGNYSTMLKQATTAKFTATEDMVVGMLIRKPDKSALTAEELANIVIYDSQFGMIGVEGSAKRFTVEAETIDGGTASTRAAIFLPESYSDSGKPTRLIVMTNGHSAHLTNSVWNKNSAENVQVIRNYLNAGYAVWVVDNTAASTSQTPDLGCPQLVDSYFKAYEYIQNNLNVEKKFSIHARSFGTFAAIRIMREHPELVKCAVMTGSRVSIKAEWPGIKKAHVAKRFDFTDTTGATYEADKLVGYDPYTDVNDATYALPPTFWMLAEGDSTAKPSEFIEKLITHGNDVTLKIYSDISHTGICTLNTSETFADALSFLNMYQSTGPIITQQPVNGEAKLGERYCVTVEAEGEGLTYQWYFRNTGEDAFRESSVTSNAYSDIMTNESAGREVYCVITDTSGNSVTTNTVKLICLDPEEPIITGDLDGDGEVTDWDAILLNRYLAGWKITVDLKAADIDQDGEVTDWDGILLDRYLAGWNIDL